MSKTTYTIKEHYQTSHPNKMGCLGIRVRMYDVFDNDDKLIYTTYTKQQAITYCLDNNTKYRLKCN